MTRIVIITPPTVLFIPDGMNFCGAATGWGSRARSITIAVNHFAVRRVEVGVNGLSHPLAGELRMQVAKTGGTGTGTVMLVDRLGWNGTPGFCGTSGNYGGAYLFSDSASSSLWSQAGNNDPSSRRAPTGPRPRTAPSPRSTAPSTTSRPAARGR